ncbi:MAG TPA: hypothetical protein DIC60_00740 [Lachnospiraceae bacterium]|nr:hypothetical protein [Lachnospiraceae bacterium]
MIIVNVDYIPGKEFELLGIVKGCTVQSKNIGRDLAAGIKTIVGGEIKGYTEMIEDARRVAEERMADEARRMNADAVINVRYTSSSVMQAASEVLAFGTAVKFK